MTKLIVPIEEKKDPLIHRKINRKPIHTDSIEAMTPEKDKMVYGQFLNVECPGQPAKISGKYYRGMEYYSEVMEDGKKYKIPLSVARFINERCMHFKHTHLMDEKGNPIKSDVPTARYKFIIEQMVA